MLYDNAGVVLQTKDTFGHVVNSTPDPSHNYSVPSAITTGNLASTMQWNGAFQPTSATSPTGATSGASYDAYGRPSGGTSAYGVGTGIFYSYSPPTKTVTTKNRFAKSTLDGFGRELKSETGYTTTNNNVYPPTTATTTLSVTETQYAPCGCTPMGKTKQVSVPRTPGANAFLDRLQLRWPGAHRQRRAAQQLRNHAVLVRGQHRESDRPGRSLEDLHHRRDG